MTTRFIALLTDFGWDDGSAATLEAVIASINPDARVIHMSHTVPGWNIATAATFLEVYFRDYPAGTVFVAVVDPGVGTERKPIMVHCDGYYFVGPDNGIFTRVLESVDQKGAVELSNSKFWKGLPEKISTTFHGRDIFAPVAAHFSNGVGMGQLGHNTPVNRLIKIQPFTTIREEMREEKLFTKILFVDRWGNMVIGVKKREFLEFTKGDKFQILINNCSMSHYTKTFAELPKNVLGLIFGGDFGDYGTIAMNERNAAKFTKAEVGTEVVINRIGG